MADKKIKVRVLADGHGYPVNSVPSLTETEAKAAVAEGWADDAKAAVDYAETLGIALPESGEAEAPAAA